MLGRGSSALAEPTPSATMQCRVEAGSGRLLCTVRVAPVPGRSIAWSDALVIATPTAARALRSRAASKSEQPDQVVLAFVIGSGAGGRIAVVSRAVSCPTAPRKGACTPVTNEVGFDFVPPA
jgi:hypothetical protein